MVTQRGVGERAGDERSATLLGDDEPFPFELAVGLGDGVRVDREVGHDLAHGRQLVADVKQPEAKRLSDLLDDLEVRGDARTRIVPKLDHP